MRASVICACLTASSAITLDSCTREPISLTEADNSCAAAASNWTLDDACSDADATVAVR